MDSYCCGTTNRRDGLVAGLAVPLLIPMSPPLNSTTRIGWQDGPSSRGTYDILSLCLSTLLVSTWSAVHIDIPIRNTFYNIHIERLRWLLIGLFAPEYLVVSSLGQFLSAVRFTSVGQKLLPTSGALPVPLWRRFVLWAFTVPRAVIAQGILSMRLLRTMSSHATPARISLRSAASWRGHIIHILRLEAHHRARPAPAESSSLGAVTMAEPNCDLERCSGASGGERKHPWTLTHGFYAQMGGFVIDTSTGGPFLPFPGTRVTLTLAGVRYLMTHAPELLPDISADEIMDKSKATAFTKGFLCSQLLFFCANCAARLHQRLPLSLLEVTTLAHSICALMAYLLWWYKPQDVAEPTIMSGGDSREICALMMLATPPLRVIARRRGPRALAPCPAEIDFLQISREPLPSEGGDIDRPQCLFPTSRPKLVLKPWGEMPRITRAEADRVKDILESEVASKQLVDPIPWWILAAMTRRRPQKLPALSERDLTRIRLAERAILRYPLPGGVAASWRVRFALVRPSTYNFRPGPSALFEPFKLRLCIGFILFPLLFGAPHVLGIREIAPNLIERRLWLSATVILIAAPIPYGVAYMVAFFLRPTSPRPRRQTRRRKHGRSLLIPLRRAFDRFCLCLMFLPLILYPLSAIFVLVESCRQLFALPPEAFIQPQFTIYLPHLS